MNRLIEPLIKLFYWPERFPTIEPRTMRCLHFWGFIIWALNLPLAISLGWLYAVVYVSAASIYANLATHLAGWSAERPSESVD
jgi:hypothetical protein